jgi:hypothetical protein
VKVGQFSSRGVEDVARQQMSSGCSPAAGPLLERESEASGSCGRNQQESALTPGGQFEQRVKVRKVRR